LRTSKPSTGRDVTNFIDWPSLTRADSNVVPAHYAAATCAVSLLALAKTPQGRRVERMRVIGPMSRRSYDKVLREVLAAAVRADRELNDGRAELLATQGQSVCHWAEDGQVYGTQQLGQPAWIAEATGLPVAGFRPRDIAARRQGAPLVSLVDLLWLRSRPGRPDRGAPPGSSEAESWGTSTSAARRSHRARRDRLRHRSGLRAHRRGGDGVQRWAACVRCGRGARRSRQCPQAAGARAAG
jgi:hypothetical protein